MSSFCSYPRICIYSQSGNQKRGLSRVGAHSEDEGGIKDTYSIAGILNRSAGPVPLEPNGKESRCKKNVSEAQMVMLMVLRRTMGLSRGRGLASTLSGGNLNAQLCHAFLDMGLLSHRFSSTKLASGTGHWLVLRGAHQKHSWPSSHTPGPNAPPVPGGVTGSLCLHMVIYEVWQ